MFDPSTDEYKAREEFMGAVQAKWSPTFCGNMIASGTIVPAFDVRADDRARRAWAGTILVVGGLSILALPVLAVCFGMIAS